MTIDECIHFAERECQEPPCESPADCDIADCCLAVWVPDAMYDEVDGHA